MSNHGTPPLRFIGKLVERLPNLSDELVQYWENNGGGLAAVLEKVLNPADVAFLVGAVREGGRTPVLEPGYKFLRRSYGYSTNETMSGYLRRHPLPTGLTGSQMLRAANEKKLGYPRLWADQRHAADRLLGQGSCALQDEERLVFPGCTVVGPKGEERLFVVYYRGDQMDFYHPPLDEPLIGNFSLVYVDPH